MKEQAEKLWHKMIESLDKKVQLVDLQSALEAAREEGRKEASGGDWCSQCGKPQYVSPQGEHLCATAVELQEDIQCHDIALCPYCRARLKEEVRKEESPHDHSTCPDCAKLKADGAEELRMELLTFAKKLINEGSSFAQAAKCFLGYLNLQQAERFGEDYEPQGGASIGRVRTQAPKPKVPGWWRKFMVDYLQLSPGDRANEVVMYDKYLAHVCEEDAHSIPHAPKLDAERLAISVCNRIKCFKALSRDMEAEITAAIRAAMEGK